MCVFISRFIKKEFHTYIKNETLKKKHSFILLISEAPFLTIHHKYERYHPRARINHTPFIHHLLPIPGFLSSPGFLPSPGFLLQSPCVPISIISCENAFLMSMRWSLYRLLGLCSFPQHTT